MLYSEKVMDHFTNPRNVGEMPDASCMGEVGNAKCGDIMRIYLKINDDGVITDAKFNTFGCMATEMVKGRTIAEARKLTNQEVVDALDGLPAQKIHCSVLADEAINAALDNYEKEHTTK